ncbi:hypothetical protein AB0K20_17965 [Micromonospora matsumotoense]|uniref:hypothetical protein n=1 Tax=Micromonospora matsumotoense TaxID=121616 RepID=UPI0034346B3E
MTRHWSENLPSRAITTTGSNDFPDIDVNPPTAAAEGHLLDGDLLSPSRTDEKHLAGCGWCQQRQQVAALHDDDFDDEDFLKAARQRAQEGGAAAMAEPTRLAPALFALVQGETERADIAVGQLWRLRWEDATELGVVVDVDRWWVTVAPVTTDLAAADEFSPLFPPTVTALNVALTACISLECVVPLFVFDRQVAPASRPTLDATRAAAQLPSPEALRDIWLAWRRGDNPPADLVYGTALDDGDLDRRELRTTIATSFTTLVGASSCAPADPLGDVTPLAERVNNTGLALSRLAAQSGLTREVFMRIKQGGRVTATEAEPLAQLLETDVRTVLESNPPLDDDLVMAVSRPRHRPALRALAQHDSDERYRTEDTQRWRIAETVASQAARSVANAAVDAPTHWDTKVDNYLQLRMAVLPLNPRDRQ